MKLYVIRHGETVDNVAQVYGGIRDSALSNHGEEQTRRLGQYFTEHGVRFTHIFASPLSRAFKTAQAIEAAQPDGDAKKKLEIIRTPDLIERNYGSFEGKPYATRSEWRKEEKSGRGTNPESVETTESMARRCDNFLDELLLPLFDEEGGNGEYTVAIIAHGMLNSHLWRRLLLRLPRKSLSIAPEITAGRGNIVLEHLGSWSNTGYLEMTIRRGQEPRPTPSTTRSGPATDAATLPTPVPPPLQPEGADISIAPPKASESPVINRTTVRTLSGYVTTILLIDSKEHLIGLKRQRGGIGSATHDSGQKKLESFFPRQKLS